MAVAWLVLTDETADIDHSVKEQLSQIRGPALDKFMRLVSGLFHPGVLFFFSALIACMFLIHNRLNDVFALMVGVGGSIVLQFVIKQIFERIRPAEALSHDLGYSFPSGHTTTATVFFLLVIYLFSKRFTNSTSRILFVCANLFLILLVGFSRIYLHLHWTSDVAAGFVIGFFWTSVLMLLTASIRSTVTRPDNTVDQSV
jgi:undecaprenyl-diphosphatase